MAFSKINLSKCVHCSETTAKLITVWIMFPVKQAVMSAYVKAFKKCKSTEAANEPECCKQRLQTWDNQNIGTIQIKKNKLILKNKHKKIKTD